MFVKMLQKQKKTTPTPTKIEQKCIFGGLKTQ